MEAKRLNHIIFFVLLFLGNFANEVAASPLHLEQDLASSALSSGAEIKEKNAVTYAFIEAGEINFSVSENNRNSFSHSHCFFSSIYYSRQLLDQQTVLYLKVAVDIEPGLQGTAIVFPFHYFW